MARHRCGTPPILAFAALEGGLSVFEGVDMAVLRRKLIARGIIGDLSAAR